MIPCIRVIINDLNYYLECTIFTVTCSEVDIFPTGRIKLFVQRQSHQLQVNLEFKICITTLLHRTSKITALSVDVLLYNTVLIPHFRNFYFDFEE